QELAAIKEESPCTRGEFLPAQTPPGSPRLALTHRAPEQQGKTSSTTRLWELTREKEKVRALTLQTLHGHQAQFSSDVSRSLPRTEVFVVGDTNTGQKLATFPPPGTKEVDLKELAGCSLSPDGRSVVALTRRGQLFVGEVDSGKFNQAKR